VARAKKQPEPEREPEYFRHSGMPEWGTCVLVRQTKEQRTYLFADGKQRTFKEEFAWLNFRDAPPPTAEDRVRLGRGLVAGGAATPRALHLELEAQIRARPDDIDPYLVYADWLQDHDDPRGTLIALQHELLQAPDDRKLRAAEKALLRDHGDYLLPAALAPLLPTRPSTDPFARSEVAWRLGFIERVRFARKRAGEDDLPMNEIVASVLDHPSSQFLRAIVLGPLGARNTASYVDALATLARRERPFLEQLVIGDVDPLEIPFTTTGNLAPILGALPALRSLDVRTATLRLDAMLKHASLRELRVITTSLSAATLRRLSSARLPALERLDFTCVGLHAGNTLGPLFAAAGVPALRHVAIRGSRGTRDLLDSILTSKLGAQLESLVLERGDLDDRDLALVIHARGPALKKLQALDLSGNRLTAAGSARLAELIPEHAMSGPRPSSTPEIAVEDVLELAPDRESVKAARTVARPSRWNSLGRDPERVWGQYKGTQLYFVSTRLNGDRAVCSCASYKEPCKHVLGLLLIVASGHAIETRPVPPSVRRNTPDLPRRASE